MRLPIHFYALVAILTSLALTIPSRPSLHGRRANLLGRDWSLSKRDYGALVPRTSQTDLEDAAMGFINLMKTIENGKYADRKVLIVGGMAIQKYYPGLRDPPDCDLKVQSGRPPVKSMKEAMARLDPDKKFVQNAMDFVYTVPSGTQVGVDAIDSALSPYNPGGYKPASEVNSVADLPYISKSDLLVSKLISCTERTEQPKADKDAKDAYQVVLNDANQGGISLTAAQKQAIKDSQTNSQCIDLVCESTCTSKKWWNKQLGLQIEE